MPTGLGFIRYAKAMCIAGGDVMAADAYAEGQRYAWADTPEVVYGLKAAVSTMSTGNTETLVASRPLAPGFLELVRPRSLIDKIIGMRQVPANVSMLRVTAAVAAAWAGEGEAKPVGAFSLDRQALEFNKITCQCVFTQELVRASGRVAEMVFGHELARGVAQFGNSAFIDPSRGPVDGVSPGSITHGVTPISSSGSTLAAVQADLKELFAAFVAADGSLETAVLVMAPRTALALGMLTGTSGAPAFPNVGPRGGTLVGTPVFTTSACMAAGSPDEAFMVLFDPAQIMIADDENADVRTARHATVQMSDSPSSGATQQVSLWQNGLMALMVERSITWRRTSDAGVAVLADLTY